MPLNKETKLILQDMRGNDLLCHLAPNCGNQRQFEFFIKSIFYNERLVGCFKAYIPLRVI